MILKENKFSEESVNYIFVILKDLWRSGVPVLFIRNLGQEPEGSLCLSPTVSVELTFPLN